MKIKLFLSYSHFDDPNHILCQQIKDSLARDFDVWFDEVGLHVGNLWWDKIRGEVEGAEGFICLLSNNWIASPYCQKELDLALNKNKRMFPIKIEKIDELQLHPRLRKIQYLSALDRMGESLFTTSAIVELKDEINSLKPSGLTLKATGIVYDPSILTTPPDLEWCDIPEGNVVIKYDKFSQKMFSVPAFRISKYPVTNVQYQTFLLNGYENRIWWHYSNDAYEFRLKAQSADIGDEDCPYVNVSWYDAIAFCRWLSDKLEDKVAITLPTEMQWQGAAQGDDNRAYPWGNEFDKNRCNTLESDIGKPTFVTRYQNGSSPYGVQDMSGNVWEWCLNDYRTPRYTNTHDLKPCTLRGGSWSDDFEAAKVTSRISQPQNFKSDFVGFRLAYKLPG